MFLQVSELKQNLARQIDAAPPIVTKPDTDYKPYVNTKSTAKEN